MVHPHSGILQKCKQIKWGCDLLIGMKRSPGYIKWKEGAKEYIAYTIFCWIGRKQECKYGRIYFCKKKHRYDIGYV